MPAEQEADNLRNRLRPLVNLIFSDDMMIGLAVILAVIVILQEFHDFSSGMQKIFDDVNYFIIAAFAAEYLFKLYVDKSRISYITDPLHILDLFIIAVSIMAFSDLSAIPFISPDISKYVVSSPVLRLLRLLRAPLRAVLVFALAGSIKASLAPDKEPEADSTKSLKVASRDSEGNGSDPWEESLNKADAPGKALWIDFQNAKRDDLMLIEKASEIPSDELNKRLIEGSFPRIDYYVKDRTVPILFLWDSKASSNGSGADDQDNRGDHLLIICKENRIFTLSTGENDLFENYPYMVNGLPDSLKNAKYNVRALYSLLRMKMNDYDRIIQHIEKRTSEFESIPVDETTPKFLKETFQFKKEIQKISGNLWHFHQILHKILQENNLALLEIKDYRQDFEALLEESQYMCRTAHNIQENIGSLIELHTNTVSYDMNRVMKVIAVITCLAVIPSVIGGLLGINLVSDKGPEGFHMYVSEVVFLIFSFMLMGTYAFYKMGWLR